MLYIFADDAKMYCHIKDVADKLQKGIENCVKWTEKWQVTLNIDKCNYFCTSPRYSDVNISGCESLSRIAATVHVLF